MTERAPPTDFADFYRRHSPDVFRFAYYLCRNKADAEDIASETFVRAWAGAEKIQAETAKAYLLTIARNLHVQLATKARRESALDDSHHDRSANPLERAEVRSDIEAMRERLLEMRETDRAAFLMRVVDEMSYEDIANALSISLSSAKVRVHRARLSLADIR